MKYLCLVYQDDRKLATLSASEYDALVDETLDYDEEMRHNGHYTSLNALAFVETATSVRVRDERMSISDGPFIEATEQLGGYLLIEARDLNEAIRIAARMPSARMGGIEIRPVKELTVRRTSVETDGTAPLLGSWPTST